MPGIDIWRKKLLLWWYLLNLNSSVWSERICVRTVVRGTEKSTSRTIKNLVRPTMAAKMKKVVKQKEVEEELPLSAEEVVSHRAKRWSERPKYGAQQRTASSLVRSLSLVMLLLSSFSLSSWSRLSSSSSSRLLQRLSELQAGQPEVRRTDSQWERP